jgi:hypothetical protein
LPTLGLEREEGGNKERTISVRFFWDSLSLCSELLSWLEVRPSSHLSRVIRGNIWMSKSVCECVSERSEKGGADQRDRKQINATWNEMLAAGTLSVAREVRYLLYM